jgi:uncharacterized protein YndB with AHSA1/START domain
VRLPPFFGASVVGGAYALLIRGAMTLDLGIGRRVRPLGPIERTIDAPRETVFDVIAGPYLERTPHAMRDELHVWERSSDMALAAHVTKSGRLTTTTLETVRFERPHLISFRLVRGPVPHVSETYELRETSDGTVLTYAGELGADLWRVGEWWANRVARPWEHAVAASLARIQAEAERRAWACGKPATAPL